MARGAPNGILETQGCSQFITDYDFISGGFAFNFLFDLNNKIIGAFLA